MIVSVVSSVRIATSPRQGSVIWKGNDSLLRKSYVVDGTGIWAKRRRVERRKRNQKEKR